MTNYKQYVRVLFLGCAFLTSLSHAEGQSQYDPVARTADGVIVGDSTMLRNENRINAVIRTSDLDPGAAMTVWWRIYNRPRHCAVPYACEMSDLSNPNVDGSQLHATAFVVGNAAGTATVIASLYRTAAKAQGGEVFSESLTEGFLNGPGLRRPMDAEVELLFASHGALVDPIMVGEEAALDQLLSPGATPTACNDPALPTAARTFRCGVIQKVNHSSQN